MRDIRHRQIIRNDIEEEEEVDAQLTILDSVLRDLGSRGRALYASHLVLVEDILRRHIVFIQAPLHPVILIQVDVEALCQCDFFIHDGRDMVFPPDFVELFADIAVLPKGDIIARLQSLGIRYDDRPPDVFECPSHKVRGHIVQFIRFKLMTLLNLLLDIKDNPPVHVKVIEGIVS